MTESNLLNYVLKLAKRTENFFNSFSLHQVFIGMSFHFDILHCSYVADTLENELLANGLCKQLANDKHHFALHKEYDISLIIWKIKVFHKTGQSGRGTFIL